jgi:hypothetical protein
VKWVFSAVLLISVFKSTVKNPARSPGLDICLPNLRARSDASCVSEFVHALV